MNKIIISDPTLRDGNHAVTHQITIKQISEYCQAINKTGIDIVEVGHGNGLGASSLQLGIAPTSDEKMLQAARDNLKCTKLGIHIIPGFGNIKRDLRVALDCGVDVIRVASHCTEADITKRHIEYAKQYGKEVYGVLMMSHMAEKEMLLAEAKKIESYGADGVILMDSAGAYLPEKVFQNFEYMSNELNIALGFHAHNNLGLAVANSIAAVKGGAIILDGTAKGFGAGAGNTAIEVLVAVLHKMDYQTNVNLYKLFDACNFAENTIINKPLSVTTMNILSGLYGVFSGFIKPVLRISKSFGVDPKEVFKLLGENKVLAGQEDLIMEFAQKVQSDSGS